jgi:putative SOS response-associated peptidase YedK
MINARSETVAEKPAFRLAFERFRCLILADGFYEWKHDAGTRRKRAFHITRADGEPFAFAGLWSTWRPSSGDRQEHERVRSCAIVTRAANAAVAPLHDRMPVILDPDAEAAWLDPASPRPLLQEILRGLEAAHTSVREVGGAVNDARYDGPECLAAASPDTQATLF